MKKDNMWNRLFHKKEVNESKKQYEISKALVGFYPETKQFVDGAKSLGDLLEAHKTAWRRGYQNENLAPCPYGMFRTQNILEMTPNEVFLGDIWGLWTFPIPHWEENKNVTMRGNDFGIKPETKAYDLIMSQYRRLLSSNLQELYREAKKYVSEYENL